MAVGMSCALEGTYRSHSFNGDEIDNDKLQEKVRRR